MNAKMETVNLYRRRFTNFYTAPETNELNSSPFVGYHRYTSFETFERIDFFSREGKIQDSSQDSSEQNESLL